MFYVNPRGKPGVVVLEEPEVIGVKERVYEALEKYGDRAYVVLKAMIEVARDYTLSSRNRHGDFDYRGLVLRLKAMGVEYNPSRLLKTLEEYGIIETTYHSGGQHWWRIISLDEVEEALREYSGEPTLDQEDPEITLIKVQVESLEPENLKSILQLMLRKKKLGEIDKKKFKRIVFEDLELVVKVLKKALEYEDVLEPEIKRLREILSLALLVAKKIGQPGIVKSIQVLEAIAYQPEP